MTPLSETPTIVSIHAPTGGATRTAHRRARRKGFQFTRPRGARRKSSSVIARSPLFQFTRPRGARQGVELHLSVWPVSIHAPTGGATPPRRTHRTPLRVSIHAPTGGATVGQDADAAVKLFQFTRPRGARREVPVPRVGDGRVSIHAPTGGATGVSGIFTQPLTVSIHAPTGGATPRMLVAARVAAFQFTRPRGARRRNRQGLRPCDRFNSRAHGGRDRARRSG